MKPLVQTTRFTRGLLPHWEVASGRYFITVRCHDSLPQHVVLRLAEMHETLRSINPASPQFAELQRRSFSTLEKYLDAGEGECPLRDPRAAAALAAIFADASNHGVSIPHYAIMPNHWHALLTPASDESIDLHAAMSRLKGRASRAVNLALGRAGPLWQREWFDRWMRHDAEWDRCVAYIRNNPVKAGIVSNWSQHPWTK